MKNRSNSLTVSTGQPKLDKTLNRLMKSHKEDFTITLGEFVEESGLESEDCFNFLKNTNRGQLIRGRRGYPTRFVFGEALEKWVHMEDIRAEWRKRNGRDPLTGTLLHNPYKRRHKRLVSPQEMGIGSKSIQVNVGGQIVTIPVEVKVVD